MTNTAVRSEFEQVARQAKANKLVAVLIAHGADAETVAALPAKGRRMVAELAGCRVASDATWALVADLLRADALFAPAAA